MSIMIDTRDLVWKDNETKTIYRIIDFSQNGEIDIIWFINTETLQEHCMDIDIFLYKFTTAGLFDELEKI